MIPKTLPQTLYHPRGSISVQRALKNIRAVLLDPDQMDQDQFTAAIDDLETMLSTPFSNTTEYTK
jgi:hypothetical protein